MVIGYAGNGMSYAVYAIRYDMRYLTCTEDSRRVDNLVPSTLSTSVFSHLF